MANVTSGRRLLKLLQVICCSVETTGLIVVFFN